MSKIRLPVTYKQLCILKHALRDKRHRDEAEENLFQMLYRSVAELKQLYKIDSRTELNHEPVRGNGKRVLK